MTDPSSLGLAAVTRTAFRVWEARADLREQFGDVASIGYWNWLMTEGPSQYPEILVNLPIPEMELAERVGNASVEHYLKSGISDAQNIFECLMEAGFDPATRPAVFDFGCGCGRILRCAARLADSCELVGADIDTQALEWSRANLDFAQFDQLSSRPPAPYPDGRFQAVYSFSVFTHLPEPLHREWLEELHRITTPGAAIVLTVAGRRVIELFVRGELEKLKVPTPEQLMDDLPMLEDTGYLYYPYPPGNAAVPEEDSEAGLYGMTFLLESYVRKHWLDLFELVAYHEARQDWQDWVVLRRR